MEETGKSYATYFIVDGQHVGSYDAMYRDLADPWNHLSERHELRSDRALAAGWLVRLKEIEGIQRVTEFGCGLGHVTEELRRRGLTSTGVDIASSAVARARALFPESHFVAGSIGDVSLLHTLDPEVIFMSHITWSCLENLKEVTNQFLEFARQASHPVYLVHMVALFPRGVQKYGREYFTTHEEVLHYFRLQYTESALISYGGGFESDKSAMSSLFLARLG